MKRTVRAVLSSFLLVFLACGKDYGTEEVQNPVLDFNFVTITDVSESAKDGFRTICLIFSDRKGNSLEMKAGSCYSHLEAGWYDITSEADARMKAEVLIDMNGSRMKANGGSVYVRKKDYEYLIRFEVETDNGVLKAIADGKKLYFDIEDYPSISSGSEGNYLKDLTIRSEILNSVMKYSIYLPDDYDGIKEYPVLYMLHGMGGANNDWLQDNAGWSGGGSMPAYAEEYADATGADIIIVSPEGRNLFYCNGYENGVNYMSYFFEEFVPFIESEYAVRSERSSRAIGGLSMGGYGSLYYGFLHPEMFCHVYACSSAVGIGGAAPDLVQFLASAASSGSVKSLPELTIEIGTEDFLFTSNEAFVRTLDSYGVPYEYITRKGTHDWKFWNACSPKIIRKSLTVFE